MVNHLPTMQETWVQSLGRLSESDIINQLQIHFQHFLFEVPHEQVWVGEEFGRSHSPALSIFGVEFSGHIQFVHSCLESESCVCNQYEGVGQRKEHW